MNITEDKLRLGLQELEKQRNTNSDEAERGKLGRVLTVIDGAISDPEQRKAAKDLIHTAWYQYGGQYSLSEMNSSQEALLFEALTDGKLWDDSPPKNAVSAKRWNPFTDKLK